MTEGVDFDRVREPHQVKRRELLGKIVEIFDQTVETRNAKLSSSPTPAFVEGR
jgi:hypothetical protein